MYFCTMMCYCSIFLLIFLIFLFRKIPTFFNSEEKWMIYVSAVNGKRKLTFLKLVFIPFRVVWGRVFRYDNYLTGFDLQLSVFYLKIYVLPCLLLLQLFSEYVLAVLCDQMQCLLWKYLTLLTDDQYRRIQRKFSYILKSVVPFSKELLLLGTSG